MTRRPSWLRPGRAVALAGWGLLGLAVADWFALRLGWLRHPPALLALLVGLVALALAARLALVLVGLGGGGGRRLSRGAELFLVAGVLAALAAGSANWLLRLQGTVILLEGETVALTGGGALQEFESGLLARPDEMGLALALERFELRPAEGGFYPQSRLRVWQRSGEAVGLTVDRRAVGQVGTLRFHQGAFGFAPRLVLLRDGETLFDRTVPFLTRREGPSGVSFDGHFTLEAERLEVTGAIDLASLDEAMRGHASLQATVRQGDRLLGEGALLPGHFATLDDGLRLGFAGLGEWSEIIVSRRTYGRFVLVGGGLALAGALAWPALRWWERR